MTQPTLTIRAATLSDTPPLLTLITSAYDHDPRRSTFLTGPRIDTAGLLAKLSDPTVTILLATEPTCPFPIACCELKKHDGDDGGNTARFGLFAVDPARQGHRLGTRVLKAAEGYAREVLGVRKLEMQVIWPRSELIAWYAHRGYRETEEKRRFPYEDMVGGAGATREDLWFVVLAKNLIGGDTEVVGIAA